MSDDRLLGKPILYKLLIKKKQGYGNVDGNIPPLLKIYTFLDI